MKHYKKGFLLPMGVIFIFIMLIVGMGILYLGTLEQLDVKRRLNREKAFYLAEAGAYRAYAHIKQNRNWQPEEDALPLGDGTFFVTREDESGRINIISTGNVKGIEEKVQLTLRRGSGNSWAQGLFGSTRVTLANHSRIYGYDSSTDPYGNNPTNTAEVGSLSLISLANNSSIYGNASVTSDGRITLINNSNITGNQNTDTVFDEPLNDLPPVEIPSDLLNASPGGKLLVSGNNTYSLPGGNYRYEEIKTSNISVLRFTGDITRIYVENKVEIENNSKWDIQGTLILYLGTNSTLDVKNNSKIGIMQPDGSVLPNLPVNFRIYSASTRNDAVIMQNNSNMAGLLYVPEGWVQLWNNRKFLGGIVTKALDLYNNVKVIYDTNLMNLDIEDDPGGGAGTLRIIRWTKPNWINRLQ
ncbi:MAG: hypothetical protein NC905_00285 [Candidatus Omnitrophica bacterium]|nr:hypothetical protein [Candidatus Omnitrophota bacterium]